MRRDPGSAVPSADRDGGRDGAVGGRNLVSPPPPTGGQEALEAPALPGGDWILPLSQRKGQPRAVVPARRQLAAPRPETRLSSYLVRGDRGAYTNISTNYGACEGAAGRPQTPDRLKLTRPAKRWASAPIFRERTTARWASPAPPHRPSGIVGRSSPPNPVGQGVLQLTGPCWFPFSGWSPP